ncbi:hypothetical protein SAY87_010109 [Trapa incisa]|uniref:Small ribosomal subunit protein eS31 domain-containing protein n=1 Tax=Trapa incisa TaxID=236973 RepID=A0AAN7JHQ9_9MYRT|nr:hypothetical protein SAY87_010109 [Trapa incisa]
MLSKYICPRGQGSPIGREDEVQAPPEVIPQETLMKRKKKKTYTKPKKIKHKKKKVKLAVLQFYKVDDSGKVLRLRKECPNAECGAETFMANHFDRHYWR